MRSKTKISDDNAEWILLMGFVVSLGIIFLAILLNLSAAAGQTPSESVTVFPKSQIRDIQTELSDAAVKSESESDFDAKLDAIRKLALARDSAVVEAHLTCGIDADAEYVYAELTVHYNNGVTEYDGTYLLPKKL